MIKKLNYIDSTNRLTFNCLLSFMFYSHEKKFVLVFIDALNCFKNITFLVSYYVIHTLLPYTYIQIVGLILLYYKI